MFRRFRNGTLKLEGGEPLPSDVLDRLDAAIGEIWDDNPYEARAVRRDRGTWGVGVRSIEGELERLEADATVLSLQVAVPPDGDRAYFVDGESVGGTLFGARVEIATAQALRALETRGAARFQAFVASADRVEGDLWEVRVDPL